MLAHKVLHYLGASEVIDIDNSIDPTNESDFLSLKFTSPSPITWDMYSEAYPIVERNLGTKLLRIERNKRLSNTDWIMTVDNFETLANKEEWILYRKALRDLPANPPIFKWKDLNLDFENMEMPVQPSIVRISTDNVIE